MGQDQSQSGRGGGRRPPREALEACKNKSSRDTCSFTGRGENLSGICFSPDSSKPLACRPDIN